MTELLLNSVETLNFCNLKASWRSKKINSEINTLTNEIKKAISEGDTIFKNNNASVNFIDELVNLDEQLLSSVTDEKEELILKRDRIASQLSEFIVGLPLNTREDLEFIIKQITDRQDRIASLKETLAAIKEAYPEVDNVNRRDLFDKIPILGQIKAYQDSQKSVLLESTVEKPVKTEETLPKLKNGRFVVRIKKAPQELVDLVSKTDEFAKPVINQNVETSVDNSFFGSEDDNSLMTEISEESRIAPKITEGETSEAIFESKRTEFKDDEVTDLSDSSAYNFVDISLEELNAPASVSKEASTEEVKYTMNQGDTLSNLALTLYGDENAWFDIFNANQTALTARLKEQSVADMSNIEHNKEVFTGIELSLPNEYTKGANNIKLAA
jgi:curved DNA-binding protein CbpA